MRGFSQQKQNFFYFSYFIKPLGGLIKMEKKNSMIVIDGTVYVPKGSEKVTLASSKGRKYVIVRARSAGVFAGFLEKRVGQEVTLTDARRLWYWKGAASLSQLALEGVKNPNECKFPAAVPRVVLLEVIEILDVTTKARECIEKVPVWAQ